MAPAHAHLLQGLDGGIQLLLAHADGGGVEAVLRGLVIALHVVNAADGGALRGGCTENMCLH